MPCSVRAEMQNAFMLFSLFGLLNAAIFFVQIFIQKTHIYNKTNSSLLFFKINFLYFSNWEAATLLFGLFSLFGKE